ncbi:MAG: hydantoinase/oxoprolinase family protein [Polyangiales bacterium]
MEEQPSQNGASGIPKEQCVLGVDVGGTNTDAVLLSGGQTIASIKVPTTPDVESGMVAAVSSISGSNRIERAHVGTTAFTNALIQRKGLAPAAAIRIGTPVSRSLPPMIDWPPDLRASVTNPIFFVAGGREYDGRPIRPVDRDSIRRIGAELAESGVTQAAITSVFGTTYPDDELQVAQWLQEEHPRIGVSLSHQIGRFGILERENATLLNAMLRPLAAGAVHSYQKSIRAPLFISQNDGTCVSAQRAANFPVFSIASGPTNSLRGAALLTELEDAIVLDVGGTTTDAGRLRRGFPQPASLELEIAGVRTNFRMPDVVSIGIGGGSIIDVDAGTVGPKSVGHRLQEEAVVFGGSTLTLTDIAVAAGRIELGDPEKVRGVDRRLLYKVDTHLRASLHELTEQFERANEQLPLILVGGGAPLIEHIFEGRPNAVRRPDRGDIANAIGSAIAQVSGEVELTFSLSVVSRDQALAAAEEEAHRRAEQSGANPETIRTVELEDAALSYLASDGVRVRARAIGDLEVGR